MTLDEINIKEIFMCINFELNSYGMDAWCSSIDPYIVVIFWKTKQDEEPIAIQVEVPIYKGEDLKKNEINWNVFRLRFIEACFEIEEYYNANIKTNIK